MICIHKYNLFFLSSLKLVIDTHLPRYLLTNLIINALPIPVFSVLNKTLNKT